MATLRTGVGRLALHGREAGSVRGLRILPIGLVFERKEAPRSRILAVIGQPLALDSWRAPSPASAIAALTAEIDARLRAVTLNYNTAAETAGDARPATPKAALAPWAPTGGG